MAPAIRSIIRKIDEFVNQGEFKEAYNQGILAIQEFDESREYKKSIKILEKLIESAKKNNNTVINEKFIAHLIIRYILSGQFDKAKSTGKSLKDEFTISIAEITKSLLKIQNKEIKFVLEGIEKQTIFGNYEQIKEIPFLNFANEDDAIKIIEDYFPIGRYIINLIDVKTSLHHSHNFDVGQSQEVNVVENRRILRISD